MKKTNAYDQILDVAEDLVQKVGFNAFSYADIAEKIGIKKASIHYHFPAKTDLGKAMMARHRLRVSEFLANLIIVNKNCKDILGIYLKNIFASTYEAESKMCLGGMLAADVVTLDQAIQSEVKAFFHVNEEWLKKLLIQGKKKGEFKFTEEPSAIAKQILATIEGTLLLARLFQEKNWLNIATKQVFELVH